MYCRDDTTSCNGIAADYRLASLSLINAVRCSRAELSCIAQAHQVGTRFLSQNLPRRQETFPDTMIGSPNQMMFGHTHPPRLAPTGCGFLHLPEPLIRRSLIRTVLTAVMLSAVLFSTPVFTTAVFAASQPDSGAEQLNLALQPVGDQRLVVGEMHSLIVRAESPLSLIHI